MKKETPKKPRILFMPWEQTGVGLYRVIIPAMALGKRKLADVTTYGTFTGTFTKQGANLEYLEKVAKGKEFDIFYTTKPLMGQHNALCQALQDMGSMKWVMDMDDNIMDVNADNPGYGAFKKDGSGDNVFYVLHGIKNADLVVVSTENLKKVYEKFNSNIYVNPNTIDFRFWKFDNKHDKTKKIRIGWAGATGHKYDLSMLNYVFKYLKKKYKDKIEVVTFGGERPQFSDEHHDWVELGDYPKKLAELGFDIGIAPLRDNIYNRGKSNLRWLEYSSLKVPTVASKVESFQNTNALLCSDEEEWIDALSCLIEQRDLRRELGDNAYKIVKKDFNASKEARKLNDRLIQLIWKDKKLTSEARKFLKKRKQE